jgi:CTP-dependent riboflavin kinase
MRNIQQITINGFDSHSLCYLEALGMSKVFEAYASIGEEILEDGIGFNPYTGYVYIALENGVSICSMLGRDVEYLVTDFYNGEERFFDNYEDALNFDCTIED